MSLVTLIKSADTSLRDAVVQVEEWALPAEAKATGAVDEAGRKVYTVLKADEAKVVAEVKKEVPVVEKEVKTVLGKIEAEVEKIGSEVKTEVKKFVEDVEGLFHKDAAPVVPVANTTDPTTGGGGGSFKN